ncbi:acyltransferase family protein [Mesorhizobium sp. NPDC059054]|uniref:acyltransferase family protein n=1 Tax=Mesorhizobium sp. NPDC059054 TaxID=3346711 RepID=UPI0036851134
MHTTISRPAALTHRRELDGLRFFAFLLVFVHHFPAAVWSETLIILKGRGWVGVELFFAISAYLFFYLLGAEQTKIGRIDIPKFFMRRFLRIYPLMIVYATAMVLIYSIGDDPRTWPRLLGIALSLDNLVTWVLSYNVSVPFATHLWTLSSEFQIYLVIPVAFLVYMAMGRTAFLWLLVGIVVFSTLARAMFVLINTPYVNVWVTPFLRPESVIGGIALSIIDRRWNPLWSLLAFVVAAFLFFYAPSAEVLPWGTMLGYPISALMWVSLLDFALRNRAARSVLSYGPLPFLGTISFGLYVFHWWAMNQAFAVVGYSTTETPIEYLALGIVALGITVLAALASYFGLERFFLKLKAKVTIVGPKSEVIAILGLSEIPMTPLAAPQSVNEPISSNDTDTR